MYPILTRKFHKIEPNKGSVKTTMRLASMEMDSWKLASGEKRHARSNGTFEIPSQRRRQHLNRGDSVKLIFKTDGGPVERMWVVVTECVGSTYIGILNNRPIFDHEYVTYGAEIPFTAKHVIDVGDRSTDDDLIPTHRWPHRLNKG